MLNKALELIGSGQWKTSYSTSTMVIYRKENCELERRICVGLGTRTLDFEEKGKNEISCPFGNEWLERFDILTARNVPDFKSF